MLSSIMQNFFFNLCTTILDLTVRRCRILSECNIVAFKNQTQFNVFVSACDWMHATILRCIRDVQRLTGNPCTSCDLFETVHEVVELKYITLVFTIRNMY